ncbi:MAG: ATP-binding protein [Pseudobdellovibrionaceae bacterium]
MKLYKHRDFDSFGGNFQAYRLPTIIIAVGLILSVFGFQLALQYDFTQDEQTFQTYSDQIYRTVDTEIRRHEQQITAIGRLLGQIRNFSESEFSDVSNAFTASTYFSHISLFKLNDDDSVTDLYPDAAYIRKLSGLSSVPAIIEAMRKSEDFNTTYLSSTFDYDIEGERAKLAAFVTPVTNKYRQSIFLVGVINLTELFQNTLIVDEKMVNARITRNDGTQSEGSVVYEQYEPNMESFFRAVNAGDLATRRFKRHRFFEDYAWEVIIYASPQGALSTIGILPWIALVSLLSVTALIGYLAFRITFENVRVHMLVEKQTESLRAYTEKLEQRNRDLDDFAYIASHDLKEPLRGIYNYSEFLYEDHAEKLPPEGRDMLNTLRVLSRRMETLIDNLLKYSRLSREDLNYKSTDIQQVIQESLETLAIMIKEKKIKVKVEENIPHITCDPNMTGEVFRNLITNAIKYNDKESPEITIGCKKAEGEIPVFFVKDNGIGIPERHFSTIFKIFKRLHGRDEFGGGTGSGLTIVKRVIDRHKGRIWIESVMGEGTTFFFTLNPTENEPSGEDAHV